MQPKINASDIQAFLESELFHQVQTTRCFRDSKTFADATLRFSWQHIKTAYDARRIEPDFNLKHFVLQHFDLPDEIRSENKSPTQEIKGYIRQTWNTLIRQPDTYARDSLIPLPHCYVVPGGRFREIYYWDTYFTALGLAQDGQYELIQAMWDNFLYLQKENGHIPNGNRHYYRSRSQPPVLALMAQLLPDQEAPGIINALEQEYLFWMGSKADPCRPDSQRVVQLADGCVLNRYYDELDTPRPESYVEDIELSFRLPEADRPTFFRNLRAACESGWDFSSRWLRDENDLSTICTTEIVPVDLNCLLLILETQLAMRWMHKGEVNKSKRYQLAAAQREQAMQQYFWSPENQMFFDFDIKKGCRSTTWSAAGLLPLYCGLATKKQAKCLKDVITQRFLHKGGVITTLNTSQQQWDAPNGWAPIQWFVVDGLLRYGYRTQAVIIMHSWLDCVEHGFSEFDGIMEKYNVQLPFRRAEGGEYEVQSGFGWTNGVTRVFLAMLEGNVNTSIPVPL